MNKALSVKKSVNPLQKLVEQETENRAILTQFITDHMVRGLDYGSIHMSKVCPNKYNPSECKIASHFSKDCLFKPGSEKFASLMKLTPKFRKDAETWEMAGSKPGLICYVCELVDLKDRVVGEGRGSADITEKNWSMNNTIKIAEKRAQIDAVLRSGGLSDFFTQDLEDVPMGGGNIAAGTNTTEDEENETIETSNMASLKQTTYISGLLARKGYTKEELMRKYEVSKLEDLTKDQAMTIITNLQNLTPRKTTQAVVKNETASYRQSNTDNEEPPIDLDEAERGIEQQRLEGVK